MDAAFSQCSPPTHLLTFHLASTSLLLTYDLRLLNNSLMEVKDLFCFIGLSGLECQRYNKGLDVVVIKELVINSDKESFV